MKRILVTGANKGIGLAIATAILERSDDSLVVMGSRDLERGQRALDSMVQRSPAWETRLTLLQLDVASDDSVAQAARTLRDRFPGAAEPLYGIVNNAGIGPGSANAASVLEVNLFGLHRVCRAFIPLLDPAAGRIVNITSASGPNFVASCGPGDRRLLTDPAVSWTALRAFIDDHLNATGGVTSNAYGLSKACANSYTLILARENPNLLINACTPGWIETDMTRPDVDGSGKSPAEMGMKPPAEGTRSALFLLLGQPDGSGRYYGSDALRSPLDAYRAPGDPPYTGD